MDGPVSRDSGRRGRARDLGLLAATLAVVVVALLVTRARIRQVTARPPRAPEAPVSADLRGRRLAVPDCIPRGGDAASGEACRTLTTVLRSDLAFEHLFDLVPEGEMGTVRHLSPECPNLGHWRSIGAGLLALNRAEVSGTELTVETVLFAVDSGKMLRTRRHGGDSASARALAHRLSDDIVGLAGVRGVAQTRIAFNSDRHSAPGGPVKEIYVMDYDGHAPRRVTVSQANHAAPGINIMPAWHPDGRRLAYVSFTQGSADIFVSRFPEAVAQNVTAAQGQNTAAVWSPDGRRMAFSSSRGGNSDIWVANPDGSSPRRLTASPATDTAPAWSPTGREIAFTSDRSGRPQVYVMQADGRDVRRLTIVGKYNDAAAWSPSTEFFEVAYTSLGERGFEIAVLDLVTSQVRRVSSGQGDCEYPAWAPSGRHLAFACSRGGPRQITVSDREGRWVQTLPAGPGSNEYPDWGP